MNTTLNLGKHNAGWTDEGRQWDGEAPKGPLMSRIDTQIRIKAGLARHRQGPVGRSTASWAR